VKILAPHGYDEIVPLAKHHKVLLPAGGTPAFCRTVNALALSVTEFPVAARDYPIVFAAAGGGATYSPVIVLGLAQGANLFLQPSGEWDPATYVPAAVRRYPFCVSKVYVDGRAEGKRIVCVAQAYLDAGGVALFDERGSATPRWLAIDRLLSEYEADLDRSADFCAALARLGVLAPFRMEVNQGGRSATRVAGMFRVEEAKLAALKPAAHKALVTKGFMGPIYAHLHSLENFSRLYAREQAASRAPARGSGRG